MVRTSHSNHDFKSWKRFAERWAERSGGSGVSWGYPRSSLLSGLGCTGPTSVASNAADTTSL